MAKAIERGSLPYGIAARAGFAVRSANTLQHRSLMLVSRSLSSSFPPPCCTQPRNAGGTAQTRFQDELSLVASKNGWRQNFPLQRASPAVPGAGHETTALHGPEEVATSEMVDAMRRAYPGEGLGGGELVVEAQEEGGGGGAGELQEGRHDALERMKQAMLRQRTVQHDYTSASRAEASPPPTCIAFPRAAAAAAGAGLAAGYAGERQAPESRPHLPHHPSVRRLEQQQVVSKGAWSGDLPVRHLSQSPLVSVQTKSTETAGYEAGGRKGARDWQAQGGGRGADGGRGGAPGYIEQLLQRHGAVIQS